MYRLKQSGLSLVELLVALAISSFLILGVTQLYIDNKRSYVFQQHQAQNTESGRYALLIFQHELAKAGYRRRPDESLETVFPGSNALCEFTPGQVIKDDSNEDGPAVCIRFQPRTANDLDCLGNTVTDTAELDKPYTSGKELVVQRLFVEEGMLKCRAVHTDAKGAQKQAYSKADLTDGIADLRLEFGVGGAGDSRSISEYVVEPEGKPVLAVRYTALLGSGVQMRDGVTFDDAIAQWRTLTAASDEDIEKLGPDKGQLYHVVQNTIALRNLLP
ncbi:PilW family protein [Pseudomonas sp. Marseille-QA0892]